MAARLSDEQLVGKITREFDEAKSHHDYFTRLYERRERSYRGVKEKLQKPKWKHDLRPPYAFNLLETVVASQIEMGLTYEVRPSPHEQITPEEAQHNLMMAGDIEDLLKHELRVDDMDMKQRPVFLTDGIGGVGILKSYWNYVPGMRKRQGVQETVIHGPRGEVLGTVPTMVEIEEQGVLRDHSTAEVVDPRDFIWHESARDIDPRKPGGAQHLFHRCWYSFEQLKWLEVMGFVKDVDKLSSNGTRDFSAEYTDRETEVFNINRTKDLIEVLEYWCFEDGEIYTAWVANRTVVLKSLDKSPFWHGQYPFSVVSSMPQPFSLYGTSTIELIEDLQSILWELGNQRLDNVELINNAIILIRSDIDDPDAFEHYPGARWEVDDVQQVAPFQPPYQIAEVSIAAENLIKGDLQNVTSATPFAGGAETATVDQKTATGASIVMNAAQAQLAQKKYQAQFGLVREANLRLKNCQQFLDGQRLVQVFGKEGARAFKSIPIIAIQGEYLVALKPMGESEMRQERRAEASQFAQLMMGFAPLAAAAGKPLDVEAIVKWFAKKWEVEYPEQFFSAQAAAMGAAAGLSGSGGPPGQPGAAASPDGGAPPGGPNLGTTAATAVDASKPSATGGLSMSPQMFLQRAQALAGGAQGR
jgi:hypothetical protein